MKIFLTGASGFIGKHFCKEAIKDKHFIFAPSRKKANKSNKNIKWLYGDFSEDWENELAESDILIHLAAAGVNNHDLDEIFEVNVFKSLKLLKNAINYKCKNWLIISSSSEYGLRQEKKYFNFSRNTNRLPDTEYGLSKAIFTDLCLDLAKKYNCKARIMRIFSIYGEGESKKRLYPSLINCIKKNKTFYVKNPLETRDFTNIKFVSKILLEAVNFKTKPFKTHQIWHVSQNNPQKIKNFVQKIWKEKKGKNKLIFNNKSKVKFNHISDKSSTWRIKKYE